MPPRRHGPRRNALHLLLLAGGVGFLALALLGPPRRGRAFVHPKAHPEVHEERSKSGRAALSSDHTDEGTPPGIARDIHDVRPSEHIAAASEVPWPSDGSEAPVDWDDQDTDDVRSTQVDSTEPLRPDDAGDLRLVPGDSRPGDRFGFALSCSGDLLAVGAPESDGIAPRTGAVYVFRRQRDGWRELFKVIDPGGSSGARFGWSLTLQDENLFVGAPGTSVGPAVSGQVMAFDLSAIEPRLIWRLTPACTGAPLEPGLGSSILVTERVVFLGASQVDSFFGAPVAITCVSIDGSSAFSIPVPSASHGRFGSALSASAEHLLVGDAACVVDGEVRGCVLEYEFDRDSASLVRSVPHDSGRALDYFGSSVLLRAGGRWAVTGAPGADGASTACGVVFVLERGSRGWTILQKLSPAGLAGGGAFGASLHEHVGLVLVGANGARFRGPDSGAVYLCAVQESQLLLTDPWIPEWVQPGDHFGHSVILGDGFQAAGALPETSAAGYVGIRRR